ncbi:MFS transporter, partial [Escherichia coli]|uniref:MFS transporter n=2 Tax=Bacteria TaxID=2 RepID=UPI0022B07B35|nr:MFS transporter [Escherichia coli]
AALTIEYSPPKKRSLNYGIMYSGYSLGIVAAALVAMSLLPTLGWRGVIAVGALPVVLLPLVAWMLPESLEYLVSKGRISEAKALAARQGICNYEPVAPPVPAGKAPWRQVMASMFSGTYLRSTIFFWISLFCGMVLV